MFETTIKNLVELQKKTDKVIEKYVNPNDKTLNTYRVTFERLKTNKERVNVCVKTNLDINELEEKLGKYVSLPNKRYF